MKTRVVIADDQLATRRGLKALLSLMPEVELIGEAASGQEAIDLVAEKPPDVVLMDIRMPDMDGLEATRRIKSRWPDVRVVMLTFRAEYEAEAVAAGADVFLVKGESPDELRAALNSNALLALGC